MQKTLQYNICVRWNFIFVLETTYNPRNITQVFFQFYVILEQKQLFLLSIKYVKKGKKIFKICLNSLLLLLYLSYTIFLLIHFLKRHARDLIVAFSRCWLVFSFGSLRAARIAISTENVYFNSLPGYRDFAYLDVWRMMCGRRRIRVTCAINLVNCTIGEIDSYKILYLD